MATTKRSTLMAFAHWAAEAVHEPELAAEGLRAAVPSLEQTLVRLGPIARLSEADVLDFERAGAPHLIQCSLGRFWFVPTVPRRTLLPVAPMIPARGIWRLAQALIGALDAPERMHSDGLDPSLLLGLPEEDAS